MNINKKIIAAALLFSVVAGGTAEAGDETNKTKTKSKSPRRVFVIERQWKRPHTHMNQGDDRCRCGAHNVDDEWFAKKPEKRSTGRRTPIKTVDRSQWTIDTSKMLPETETVIVPVYNAWRSYGYYAPYGYRPYYAAPRGRYVEYRRGNWRFGAWTGW